MAHYWLESRLANSGIPFVTPSSAGLLRIEDAPAAAEAVEVLSRHDVDLTPHRSRGLTRERLYAADLTIVMSLGQLAEIQLRYPSHTGSVFLLRAFEHGSDPQEGAPDLADPVGRSLETFQKTFDVIRPCIEHLMMLLKHPT